ncbi:MAG: response regulator transcription factor [Chitinophagaceae bacterium]|nr:response regulator transcription factor [Chitinophagaceae bacterium]
MRVIIVDDEITSSQVLENLIQNYLPDLQILAICTKPAEAIEKLEQLRPDLVFMDIELPGMTGFDVLDKVQQKTFDIIFTTAHSQYGIKAIQFSAIDYLLKPIQIDELKDAVNRVKAHKSVDNPIERIKFLLENIQLLNNNNPFHRVALPTMEGLKFVNTQDIVRCTSSNNYTTVFMRNGEKILISRTLKDVEGIFGNQDFCRVHNSHLVNVSYIHKFLKGDVNAVVMSDGVEVEVSRRKKDELIRMLNL